MGHLILAEKLFYTQELRNKQFHELDEEYSNLGAFHFDAELYSKELKKIALKRNVNVINSHIIKVNYENNITKNVLLKNNKIVSGDLFIDCTGFHKTIFKNFNLEYISFKDRLLNDSAIVIRLPYLDEKNQKVNSTLGYALKNGWVWHIPLNDCISYGYVYSSEYCSEDDAYNELINYLNNRFNYKLANDINYKNIKFNSGCFKNSWIGNNIAIGLSSFFIEPIESTGIALFQLQIIELCKIIKNNPKFIFNYRDKFNQTIFDNITSVKDFIEMHYILSNRKDSKYWSDSSSISPNELQKNLIDLYKNKNFLELFNFSLNGIFGSYSWFLLFNGMDKTMANDY